MQKAGSGFTFVELIIVLVIIAILSTIGFVSYESYLSVGRDTAKISLMRDINTSFGTYSLKSKIPLPENKVDITASGTVFAYQGDFTESIANTIGFKGNPYDTSLDIYPTYMLGANRKDTQILHFLEDRQSTQISSVTETYAFTDYQILYPKIIGQALGIMLDSETQQPIHLVDSISASGSYDVTVDTGGVRAYYSQEMYFDSDISRIIPDKSCKRILELGGSKGNGIYIINPTGTNKIRVYCDMQVDGGGWTFIAYIDTRNNLQNLFSSDTGEYQVSREDSDTGNTNSSYSINGRDLDHTEMMVSIDNKDPIQGSVNDKLVFYKYLKDNPGFYGGPLPCGIDSSVEYKIGLSSQYQQTSNFVCNANDWRFYNDTGIMLRFYISRGIYWHSGMGGDNSGYHSGWVYVR